MKSDEPQKKAIRFGPGPGLSPAVRSDLARPLPEFSIAEMAKRAAEYEGPPLPFIYNGHQREAAMPWLSDVEMASLVRMLTHHDLAHEAVVCAARDRILHLSQENARLKALLKDGGQQ